MQYNHPGNDDINDTSAFDNEILFLSHFIVPDIIDNNISFPLD